MSARILRAGKRARFNGQSGKQMVNEFERTGQSWIIEGVGSIATILVHACPCSWWMQRPEIFLPELAERSLPIESVCRDHLLAHSFNTPIVLEEHFLLRITFQVYSLMKNAGEPQRCYIKYIMIKAKMLVKD